MTTTEVRLLRLKDAAERAGMSPRHLRRLVSQGRGPTPHPDTPTLRFSSVLLEEWINKKDGA